MKTKISTRKKSELSVEEAKDLFLRKAKVKNLSESTCRTYSYHLKDFIEFLDEGMLIQEVTEAIIDQYILYMQEKDTMNDRTINSNLRTIRAFLNFCMESKYMESFKIKLLKTECAIKETYATDELRRLLKKPDMRTCDFAELRTWAFENYLLGTGNRISSALNVRIKDLDFENSVIVIRKTKNRKQQIIPLSITLSDVLQTYLEVRGGTGEDYLFCNEYGEKGDRRTYQQFVHDYNLKRNVSRTSSHLFRHTFAKQWIMAGGDVFRLQKIMGHSDLTVTRQYVQMFGQDLQLDFEKFNPLDKLNMKKDVIRM